MSNGKNAKDADKKLVKRPVTGVARNGATSPAGGRTGATSSTPAPAGAAVSPQVLFPHVVEAVKTHTILDDKLINDFCTLVLRGLPADAICNYLQINRTSFWRWMNKGGAFLDGDGEPKEYEQYAKFVQSYQRATALYREGVTLEAHLPGNKDWIRCVTILERRDRKTWGRNEPQGGGEEQFDRDEAFL